MNVLHSSLITLKQLPKTFWKVLETFVNETKILLIPLFLVENELVTEFSVKLNLFNNYFSQQCTAIDNNSSIPPDTTFKTEQKRSTF